MHPTGPTTGLSDPGRTIPDDNYSTFRHRGRNLTQGDRSGFLTQGAMRRERNASHCLTKARRVLYAPHRTHSGPQGPRPNHSRRQLLHLPSQRGDLTQGGRSGFLTQRTMRRERLASLHPAGAHGVLYAPHRTHNGPESTTPRKKMYFLPLGDKFTLGTVFIAKRTVYGMRRRHPAHAARATPAKTFLCVPRNPAQSKTIRTWAELLQAKGK
jgi:hypothetical protein